MAKFVYTEKQQKALSDITAYITEAKTINALLSSEQFLIVDGKIRYSVDATQIDKVRSILLDRKKKLAKTVFSLCKENCVGLDDDDMETLGEPRT